MCSVKHVEDWNSLALSNLTTPESLDGYQMVGDWKSKNLHRRVNFK